MAENQLQTSLIISAYKNLPELELVLQSAAWQAFQDFEVIVAEDNDSPAMKDMLAQKRAEYNFPLKHVSHPDKGFRKGKILNEAIKNSQGKFLVFIDGDCILHRKFLYEYNRRLNEDLCIFGRRVMLGKALSDKLLATKDLNYLTFLRLLTSKSRKVEEGIYLPFELPLRRARASGLKGCNFGVSRANMYKINGFDEDYVTYTVGTDDDVEWRLQGIGIEVRSIRNKAIQYHLYHRKKDRRGLADRNRELCREKMAKKLYSCKNGLI